MATPLAEPTDVATIWRPLSPDETTRVTALIVLVSAKVRAAVPFDLDARLALHAVSPSDSIALDPVLVAGVVAGIVKRSLINTEGLQSSTRTVGPYSESKTYGTGESGELVVTPEDLAALLPRVAGSRVRTLEAGLSDRMVDDQAGLAVWKQIAWRGNWTLPPT